MQFATMGITKDIGISPTWTEEQEGQLHVKTTVTLPELNTQRNVMEDFCSFRCQDFSDVRILQLGIRRKEDASARWCELVLGVRGAAIHGYDPYMEKTIMNVESHQHLFIEMVIPLSPQRRLQMVWGKVMTPRSENVEERSFLFDDLPVLFDDLPWKSYPRVLTAHRSELFMTNRRRMGREDIAFEFTGIVHSLEGTFETCTEFPTVNNSFVEVWNISLTLQHDHYICQAMSGTPSKVVQVMMRLADSTLFGQLLQDHLQPCLMAHGPFFVAVGTRPEGDFTQVELHVALELSLEDLHATARQDNDPAESEGNLVIKVMRAGLH